MLTRPYVVKATADIVAVHKPAGMPFHSVNSDTGQGLLTALKATGCIPADRLYAVHRLDTGTSGLVLFATSSHVAGLLSQAFRERKVHKYYIALAAGRKPLKKQGSVIGDMARSRDSKWKLLRTRSDPAITRFWSTSLASVHPGLRLYLLKPETGCTHQLRVALKSNGSAILGDAMYASASTSTPAHMSHQSQQHLAPDRMYLHAAAIRVQLPQQPDSLQPPKGDSILQQNVRGHDHAQHSWFQAVDPPHDGQLFQHADVQRAMQQLLPEDLEDDYGTWFPDHKLLMSVGCQ